MDRSRVLALVADVAVFAGVILGVIASVQEWSFVPAGLLTVVLCGVGLVVWARAHRGGRGSAHE
jgi:hypothetical protein